MLSVFRLILIGVFVALFKNERYLLSFFVYIFAFGTDILDGWLARRNNWITNVGKVLDPLADKLMVLGKAATGGPEDVDAFLGLTEIFPPSLAADPIYSGAVKAAYEQLSQG